MSNGVMELEQAVRSMRPMVPAKSFEISEWFYIDLGFQPRPLTDNSGGQLWYPEQHRVEHVEAHQNQRQAADDFESTAETRDAL